MALREYDLSGRKVLITGAGRGIGKGIALVMAEAGADVGVTSLGQDSAARVAEEVRRLGRRGFGWAVDGTSVAATEAASDRILEDLGGLDILINCLGDAIPGAVAAGPGIERRVLTEDDWHKVIDLNLTQAFVGCHVFGPHLLEQRSGCVINISSFAAVRPAPFSSAYAAAKAGLTRFTESLALEWASSGVRVNAIAPGSFPDPEQAAPGATPRPSPVPGIPLGRVGELREVGLLAVYLASEASAYVTGQTICIDGGRTLL